MNRQIIQTEQAPKAVGPYSQGVIANGFVYTSGQLGIDPSTGKIVAGGVPAETAQIIKNLSAILQAAGSSLENVVKATVFLHDIATFADMNKVYMEHFTTNPPPRSTVGGVDLALNALVEIEVVAVIPTK